jgi:hypothetical protein
MHWHTVLLLAIGCVVLPPSLVRADTVELYGSGQVAGKVLKDEPNGKPPFVLLQLDEQLKIAIPKSRVQRITTADELAAYRANVVKAGEDPEKQYQLAIWCETNRLFPQGRYHMRRTVALDPDHSKARASLGYVKSKQGKWILYAQQQRNRGLISVGSRWKLPEAVALERMQDEANVTAKKWIREIARLRSAVVRGGSKGAEALEAIKAINDPLAADAAAKELKDSRGNKTQSAALRMTWVKLLERFRNTSSVRALTLAGIEEPDNIIREAALEALQQYGASSAVATYVPMLNPKKYSNKTVRTALRALSFFPDRELAMTYIEALVTVHLENPTPGPGISAGIGNNGGSGLSMGGKNKPEPKQYRNSGALTLLKMVEPGVDYGFDQQAWREHFAAQLTTFAGDLRRDP